MESSPQVIFARLEGIIEYDTQQVRMGLQETFVSAVELCGVDDEAEVSTACESLE